MKRLISGMGIMALLLSVFLGLGACKKQEQKPAEGQAQPGTEHPAEQPAPGVQPPAQPGPQGMTNPVQTREYTPVSPEVYWKVMLERFEVTKKYYEDSVAIYKKYPNEQEKANAELNELRKSIQQQMQEVFTKNGLSQAANFFPRGPERMQVQQERTQFIKDHPDVEKKYKDLRDQMNTLRQELMQYTGRGMPAGHGPGMRGPGGPGAAPVPGQPMPPAPMAPPPPPAPAPAPAPAPVPAPAPGSTP
jgi:hypothetical protein